MSEHILTSPVDLVDAQGSLIEPGFAKKPLWRYNRHQLKVPRWRMKEWDYYLVNNGKIAVAFTLSDLGYIRMASVSFLDLVKNEDHTRTILCPPAPRYTMPDNSATGHARFTGKDMILDYQSDGITRKVRCYFKNFENGNDFRASLTFRDFPDESMNILTPWPDRKHFYLNEKVNNMAVSGTVIFNKEVYRFTPEHECGVLDWGRGYWPYKSRWYWGTGSTIVDGKPIGFNLGYGFGDLTAASENVLFIDGKVHKLGRVQFDIPGNPMEPWTISSQKHTVEGLFTPTLDRKADIDMKVIRSNQHQYFGTFSGTLCTEDGRMIELKDFPCSFEDIINQY